MKKHISSSIISAFIFLLAMVLTGCGNGRYIITNKKADDEISQAIYDQLGTKVCYHSSSLNENEEVLYYFYIVSDYKDGNLLIDMVETVNEKLKEDSINSRICLVIWEVIPGGTRTMICLSNYYKNDSDYESYETLQCLDIRGAHGKYKLYNEVSTYENLKDIKALLIDKRINKTLEEEGIDWYEIWPNLEHYDIFDEYARSED